MKAEHIKTSVMVGMTGFEPATPGTPCQCTTKLCYIPMSYILLYRLWESKEKTVVCRTFLLQRQNPIYKR